MSILTLLICLNLRALPAAEARKCYVCGEGADAPFKSLPTVPIVEGTCEGFRPEEKYAYDCPPTYTSCLTQVDGDIEMRTCGENLAINDCKSANGIDYCYCSTELCNRLTRPEIRRSIAATLMHAQQHNHNRPASGHHHHSQEHHLLQQPNNSDDEDMLESSGMDGERSELSHHDRTLNVHRDVTTQITITLKPVANSEQRDGKDAAGTTNGTTDRSRDSNAIPAASSSSAGSSTTILGGFGAVIMLISSYIVSLRHVASIDQY
ncbi:uncharacterized protein LOC128272239 [Anopheles cruzii]|uniref:uncharacterized protein LOC128272239 n=1 Tax=Anopheles cruzii TaxID=68878 RepID=UPI0022EC2BAE|nr:uncharacterized protein LOC128272239 [Anopheles cruzii]